MKIGIKHKLDDNGVKVRNDGVASLTNLADDIRDLTPKEYKAFKKMMRLYRRADKAGLKWEQLDNYIGRGRTLSGREYRRTLKLSNTLRSADKELARSVRFEQAMKKARFEQAQLRTQ